MHVGILTAPLRTQPLETLIPWAASQNIMALEIDVRPGSQLDASNVGDAQIENLKNLLDRHGMRISSLASYGKLTGASDEVMNQDRQALKDAIRLAARLDVKVVCTLAGMPTPGKSKEKTILEDVPGAFQSVLELAADQGVKIALENWYATNIQHLEQWRLIFEVLPDAHFGLNFDPSHLDWQGIDVLSAIQEFRTRIFHVHAKDVSVNESKRLRVGYGNDGWWRYVLPGFGRFRWGEFITALRLNGYNDVLSIEHEDAAFAPEEGFALAARYLNGLM
jgi:sugar phosphate isomerase/epimerase